MNLCNLLVTVSTYEFLILKTLNALRYWLLSSRDACVHVKCCIINIQMRFVEK